LADGERIFWGFVRWEGGRYDPAPPFNAVLLEGEANAVVGLDDIEFELERVE